MSIRMAITVGSILLAGEAAASSIIRIEGNGTSSSRSVIVISQVAVSISVDAIGADELAQVSRSIVAVGPLTAVSDERVAAIDGHSSPTVMRGGVYGEVLPAATSEPEPVKKLSRPAQRKKERDERRAIREAIRFGEPLPQKAENQPPADQQENTPNPGG